MKKLYCLLAGFFCLGVSAQIVDIPDEFFKFKLLQADAAHFVAKNDQNQWITIDSNGDDEIEVSEALQVTELYVYDSDIFELTGIAHFSNLKGLHCSGNYLSQLDVRSLPYLEWLLCTNNNMATLDFSDMSTLRGLQCFANNLTSINLSGCTNLRELRCHANQLTSLDLNDSQQLQSLICSTNQISQLLINAPQTLVNLECSFNQLPELVVSQYQNLRELYCNYNQLTELNLNGLSNLVSVGCNSNQFTSLDMVGLHNLTSLGCAGNLLTNLDINDLTNVTVLAVNNNRLNSLDCSNLNHLTNLFAGANLLTSLYIKNGTIETSATFNGNPNLQFICADSAQLIPISNLASQYGYATCVVSDNCALSTADFEAADGLTLYPNPAANEFHIESKIPIDTIHIYNALGQNVLSAASVKIVDVSMLQPGTYFIRAYADGRTSTSKFIKL